MNIPLAFESLNETDIREEVLAPLIRSLGYSSGTPNNVIREQSLRYPMMSLGRKDTKRDPALRGKADYILEVQQRVRWVIEAKAPEITLGVDDIEQAWTYANHPEVRAVYFVLCNGRVLLVYRTVHGPEAPPVLSLTYEQLESDFQVLSNLVSPDALLRDFPDVGIDVGVPIAPGLRSIARITNGFIRYEANSLGSPMLSELQNGIREGAIERDSNGTLVVFLKTGGPSSSLQELNERLGLSIFEMTSPDTQLSSDPSHPTLLTYAHRVILPAGEKLLDLNTWKHIQLPQNITCDVCSRASGVFENRIFSGRFMTDMHYLESGMTVNMSGSFEVHLA
ncbi:type I restriction enzyme HsdR N-terminal domain-containing protein [Desulfurivibrio dismutans]|uniref:type I restriction enzyme HsdR N-terminal domain-containing protein n=1 Tax=Desulfurivibrio dismutans TaxID=1398908 RepID=UPI0023DC0E3F|nr:type I restriction enzyme HsdR N-terminal domain-containing protein [Desulfurivibrio alkaliphilus]MDF1613846.1 type I restriction enzyme HsdR N-terminal domain-containing protein [Desulfurivibrio alkaliphilus]